MLKGLLSLMLVATMTCTGIGDDINILRCENNEVVCYVHIYNGGIFCKFKETE